MIDWFDVADKLIAKGYDLEPTGAGIELASPCLSIYDYAHQISRDDLVQFLDDLKATLTSPA